MRQTENEQKRKLQSLQADLDTVKKAANGAEDGDVVMGEANGTPAGTKASLDSIEVKTKHCIRDGVLGPLGNERNFYGGSPVDEKHLSEGPL